MVKKILGFLYRETSSLNQAALFLGFFAFLSQVLAFLRDRLLAHIFGAGVDLDIYYAAFRIPDFIFVTVASVVSVSVLVPFIIEKGNESREALKSFVGNIFSFFSLLILSISLLAFFLMPALSDWLFRGFSHEELEQVIFLSRILLLSPVFLGLSNLLGSLTQAYNRFTLYALAPLLYNAGIILGIVFLGERIGILGVALGVALGAFLHALVQVPFIAKEGLLPHPIFHFDRALLKRVAMISIPRTLTLSMSSIILIFLVALASVMVEGSISILSFSINLQSVPLSLIGVSYSLAAFPTLSRRFQEKNLGAFILQMQESARFIIFWSLPLMALLIVERAQVVRVLLGTGLFDWDATRLTAAALALFLLSSVFQSLLLLFMRGFYSAGMTLKPFFINLFSSIVLIASTYALVKLFGLSSHFRYFVEELLKVSDLSGSLVLMLPLGFSIGTILNVFLLWGAFEREFRGFSRGVSRTFFESVSAAVIMGAVAYWGLNSTADAFPTDTLPGIFLQGLVGGVLGVSAGIIVLILLKSRELAETWSALQGRFWKTKVIATDPEIV
jgi:putative peptidoglycan lipid II flippase